MGQCTATSKRSGIRCKNHTSPGKKTCRIHGGSKNAKVGVDAPRFSHGRHSQYLPLDLVPRYEEYRSNNEILALHDEIALTDTRLSEVLDRIANGQPVPADEVNNLIDLRRRLVSTERRRLVDMQQMMTAEQAMVLIAAVVDTVKRHVRDPDTLDAISDELARIFNRQAVEVNSLGS